MRIPLLIIPLLTMALAGCASDDGGTDDVIVDGGECVGDGFCGQKAVLSEDARDLRVDLTADDVLDAPQWGMGDVFEQHMYFGSQDTAGIHIQTMVVDDSGDSYLIATSSQEAAKAHAAYDYPVLGPVKKANLGVSGLLLGEWSGMYDFPIEDGKEWTWDIEQMYNWNSNVFENHQLSLVAEYDDAIDTPKGNFPGFWVTGTNQDDEVLLYYNYVPAVGWFSHFWIYDLQTDDPDDVQFHAMSMGTSKRYTGTYYIDEGETLLDAFQGFFPDPAVVDVAPVPHQITVPEGPEYLLGVIVPIAQGGRSEIRVVEPDQQMREYSFENMDPEGGDQTFQPYFIDEATEPGDWTIATAGAGVMWGSYVWLQTVTEVPYELTEADLPPLEEDPAAGA